MLMIEERIKHFVGHFMPHIRVTEAVSQSVSQLKAAKWCLINVVFSTICFCCCFPKYLQLIVNDLRY